LRDSSLEVKSLYTTPVNSSVDNISGPGVDDPEMVNLPDWGEAPEGTRSIGSILNRLTDETSRAARDGLFALVDGSSVEDLQVRFQRVLGEDGTPRVRMTGKLTDWAGRAMMEKISTGEIMFTPAEGIQIDEYKISKQENLENKGKSSLTYVDSYSNGATYTAEVNGATVTFFRAIPVNAEGDNTNENSEVDFFKATQSSDIPRAWHNMFDITLPIDTTKEALEEALTNVGVASARPATEVDIKTVAENKLLTLFANLTDGKKNLTGVLRQQELQKIEKDWGVTAADVKVVPDGTQGRLTYRLPEAVAQKIVDRTGLKPLHHNIGLSSVLPAGETSNSVYDKSMSNLVRILSSGRLESTVARHISGDFGEGSSSERDVMGPGANYTFLYMNQQYGHSKTGSSTIQMVFDPVKIVSKLGFYANRGDGYGTLPAPDTSTFDEIRERKDNGEFLVKDSLSFEDSIGVNINSKMVPELIDRLKAAGIDTLGGMSLEDYFAVDVSKFVNYDKTPKTV
jgi:hypothetical protein